MSSKILLICSDYSLFQKLGTCLGKNFTIHLSPTLQDGILRLAVERYDLNILDVRAEEHSYYAELVEDLYQCTIVLAYF